MKIVNIYNLYVWLDKSVNMYFLKNRIFNTIFYIKMNLFIESPSHSHHKKKKM